MSKEKESNVEKEEVEKDKNKLEDVCSEKTELEGAKEELAQWKEKYLRANADFQNFKNRSSQEMARWASRAQEDVIKDILSIVDDFDRAFSECEKHGIEKEDQIWLDGFKMIQKSLYKLLEKYEVKEISQNEKFDPEFHEAVSQVESDKHKSGEVVHILQKGFIRNGQVLRPTKVAVAK